MSTTQNTLNSPPRRGPAFRTLRSLALLATVAALGTGATAQVSTTEVVNVVPAKAEDYPWMLGVNFGAPAFGGVYPGTLNTHYGWPTAEDLDYHKARGMELIRLAFRWERVQRKFFDPLFSSEMARFDTFLDLAEERGMLVITDMHNFGRYHIWDGKGTTAYTNYPGYIIGSPQVPRSAYADVWRKLAEHFKDRNCIWAYDIMNEPYNMGSYHWKDSAQFAINAIRQVDMDTMIMVSGDSYSSALRWPNVTNSANLYQLNDPADNLIFQAHTYLDRNQSGVYSNSSNSWEEEGSPTDNGVQHLTSFNGWLTQHNVTGFLGEFGIPDEDPRWALPLSNMLDYMVANNISGTYWAAGPRWGNYHLRSNIRQLHDESVQMQAMLPYLEKSPKTGYWPPFAWYDASNYPGTAKNIAGGLPGVGSEYYTDKSASASLTADFQSMLSEAQFAGGRGGILLDYTVPADGWATAGMRVHQGVNLAANFERDHVLSLAARSTTGATAEVYLVTLDGDESAKVNLSDYADLSDQQWHTIEIPLSDFVNADYNGSQRVLSIAIDGLPADNTAHRLMLNTFIVRRPDLDPPSTSVAMAGDATTVGTNVTLTATATASDAESAIDYVEFWVGNQRVGIAPAAPYEAEFSIIESGTYTLASIAYDAHGNSTRSAPVTLSAGPAHLLWLGEFYADYYDAGGWIYHVDLRAWLYPLGTDADNVWLWNDAVDAWMWSNQSLYPYIYIESTELTGWLYYGVTTPAGVVWYYDFSTEGWITLP